METEQSLYSRIENYIASLFPTMRAGDRLTMHSFLSRSMAKAFLDIYNRQEQILQTVDPLRAQSVDLDHIVAARLIVRDLGNYATGSLTFSRNSPFSVDIAIPEGTRCKAGNVFFKTIEDGTLLAGTLSASIDAIAEERGLSGNVSQYTINVIFSSLAGIDAVSNPMNFVGGTAEETDTELRQRYIDTTTLPGLATIEMIERHLEDLDTVQEAIAFNRGNGDVEIICDDSLGITEIDPQVTEELELVLAAGCQARGCLAAIATPGGNIEPVIDPVDGDPVDCAGGFVFVRPTGFVGAEDTFTMNYNKTIGTTDIATVVVPAGTRRGKMVLVTLDSSDDRVISIPTQAFTGANTYDVLLGMGIPDYLYNVPTPITFIVNVHIVKTTTPEANLGMNIENSITAWLNDYKIGEEVEWSDLRACATIEYTSALTPAQKHIIQGTERPFIGVNRITSFVVSGNNAVASKDGDIILLETDNICRAGAVSVFVDT